MIRINLLPHHLRPIKRTPVPYFLSVLLLLLAVATMGLLWMSNSTTILEKDVQLQNHRTQLEKLQPIIDEMKELTKQEATLKVRIKVIEEIVKDRIIWSRQLWNISRLAPPNVWFSDISLSERTTQEATMVPNAATHTVEQKMLPVKHSYLVLKGYVTVGGADQTADIYPLTFQLAKDEEFSELFTLDQPKIVDTLYNEHPVKAFTLEYQIMPREGLSK